MHLGSRALSQGPEQKAENVEKVPLQLQTSMQDPSVVEQEKAEKELLQARMQEPKKIGKVQGKSGKAQLQSIMQDPLSPAESELGGAEPQSGRSPSSLSPIIATSGIEGCQHIPQPPSPSKSQSSREKSASVQIAGDESRSPTGVVTVIAPEEAGKADGRERIGGDEMIHDAVDTDVDESLGGKRGQVVADGMSVVVEAGNSLHLTEQPFPEASPSPSPSSEPLPEHIAIVTDADNHIVEAAADDAADAVAADDITDSMDCDLRVSPEQADISVQMAEIESEPTPVPEPEAETIGITIEISKSPGPDSGPGLTVANTQTSSPQSAFPKSPTLLKLSLPEPEDVVNAPSSATPSLQLQAPYLNSGPEPDSLEEKQAVLANVNASVSVDTTASDNADSGDLVDANTDHLNLGMPRPPSPTVSIASSADVRPTPPPAGEDAASPSVQTENASVSAGDNPSASTLAPPEPTKIRRSMADYKQRKKREREEQALRAVTSPVTPITPLYNELQMIGAEKDSGKAEKDIGKDGGKLAGESEKLGVDAQEGVRDGKAVEEAGGREGQAPEVPQSIASSAEPRTPSIEPSHRAESAVQERTQPSLSPKFTFMAKREFSEERVDFSPTPSLNDLDSKGPAAMEVDHEYDRGRNTTPQGESRRKSLEIKRSPPRIPSLPPPFQPPAHSSVRLSEHPPAQKRASTPQPAEDGEITSAHSQPATPSIPRPVFDSASFSGKGMAIPTSASSTASSRPSSAHAPPRAPRPNAPAPPTQPRSLRDIRVHSSSPPYTKHTRTPPPSMAPAQPKLPGWAQRERVASGQGQSQSSVPGSGSAATASANSTSTSRPPPPSGPRALRDRDVQPRTPQTSPAVGRGYTQPPRGPLALRERSRDRERERERDRDRDRDRDRERERERHSPPRGRAPGWARSWGRSRR